jgi:hypothetical protein
MAQTIFCDAGCGMPYSIEIGMEGEPVHQWYCPTHFCEFALALMNTWDMALFAREGAEPGTEAEARAVAGGRKSRRRPGPRAVAVDHQDGAVVEDPAAEDAQAHGEGG